MMQRHWDQIYAKVGFKVRHWMEGFNFTKILDLGFIKYVDDCVKIGERAAKEYQIETMLDEMRSSFICD